MEVAELGIIESRDKAVWILFFFISCLCPLCEWQSFSTTAVGYLQRLVESSELVL